MRITIERCNCNKCSDYWLVGIGKFLQGSGFTKENAQLIANLLNKHYEDNPIIIREKSTKEGLCQNCKGWVIPEVMDKGVFCPICGQEFINIHDRDI